MAYVTATLIKKELPLSSKNAPLYDGRVIITVEFTGNAGEPPRQQRYTVGHADTVQTIRRWATSVAENLASTKNITDNLTVGQSINLTPLPTPAPTAEEIWRAKVGRFQQLSFGNWSGAMATDLAALKADIESTYKPEYL